MKKKQIEELKKKPKEELQKLLVDAREKLWHNKAYLASGKVKAIKDITEGKKMIARVLTFLRS